MSLLDASEVFQFAIRIEENGERFYREMAEKIDNDDAKRLFQLLAEQEIEHKKIFEEMLSSVENYKPVENYPEDYFRYLKSYADNIIFSPDELSKEIAAIDSPIDALTFAIKREWESISYYQEIKPVVPDKQHDLIDKIIAEERKHFTQLSEARDLF